MAVIEYDSCNYTNCGNYLCEKVCPVNRAGKKCIFHEQGQKPIISEELCIGCEICQNKCPFKAISIVNLSFDLNEPIYSYGRNLFRLYGLAVPQKNSVLGIVGRNGTGKTTLIKILSSKLIPNFGEEDASIQKVLNYYRGKKASEYFKDLYEGKVRVAIKPQNVGVIQSESTVAELLLKVGGEKELQETAEELSIQSILNRKASSLSGGESQKVAIATTGMKKADLYFFDEPSSFLDIKERLRVARYIKNLAKNSSIIVVEHDLVLLDYLSDYVNIIYGKPKVYGFVSKIKTVREGINTYIDGYSRDENYRFRDYELNFFSTQQRESKNRREKTIEWPLIKKKLGEFELEVQPNSIKRNEIIGVVGSNGIGKTTLMKILAGEIKNDGEELTKTIKISYKPQYISYNGEKTVGELFEKETLSEKKQLIIKPLELEELIDKKAKNLSGGELQRVSIALALSKKADLYLLDEPSAYLDVEQRLVVGKTIRNIVDLFDCSAMVIDHDINFVDYLSDGLMVFVGESAKKGIAQGPFEVQEGMNLLLKYLDITVRKDKDSKRPRINKPGSVLDNEQKKAGRNYA